MAIYPKVLFVHIVKSGGTSLVEMFRKMYGNRAHYSVDNECLVDKIGDFDFVGGHFHADQYVHMLEKCFAFTFIRNPVDQALSNYRFWRSHSDDYIARSDGALWMCKLARNLEFDEFIIHDKIAPLFDNQLVRQFCQGSRNLKAHDVSIREYSLAKKNMEKLKFVGTFESFERSCEDLFSLLKVEKQTIMHENNLDERAKRQLGDLEIVPKVEFGSLQTKTQELLIDMTKFDRLLYDYFKNLN